MALWIALGIAALVVIWVIATYNGLVKLRNMAREAWSGIDVQLKRRSDLIPNLVETVKGYAGHEKSTLDDVTGSKRGRRHGGTDKSGKHADIHAALALRRRRGVP